VSPKDYLYEDENVIVYANYVRNPTSIREFELKIIEKVKETNQKEVKNDKNCN